MRAVLIGLTALAAAGGCAEVPTAESLAFEGSQTPDAPGYRAIPDAPARSIPDAPVPVPEQERAVQAGPESKVESPRIVVTRFKAAELDEYGSADGSARCPFVVQAEGFPAVNEDGSQFAYWVAETLSSSDGEDEFGVLRVVDVATDSVATRIDVFDGDDFSEKNHCRKLWRHAKAQARLANEVLAEQAWRTMVPTSLQLRDTPEFNAAGIDTSDLGPHDRLAELVLQHKEAIVRVPGVKVFARTAADWDGPWEDYCGSYEAYAMNTWLDRPSGVAVVQVGQMSGPCTCYSETLVHPFEFPVTAVVAADARLERYLQAQE